MSRRAIQLVRPLANRQSIRSFSISSNPLSQQQPPTSSPGPSQPLPPSNITKDALSKTPKSSAPVPITSPPQFPPPKNPFEPVETTSSAERTPQEYSETTKTLVRGVARLMGYNSKASTAIRETGRMMRGIVESIEADRAFWYDQCKLPPTYQTFFQLHLLYVLILLPRLRSLPSNLPSSSTNHPIPEPLDPSSPTSSSSSSSTSSTSDTTAGGPVILSKPAYESYPTEFLNHFFEMAESEMRVVLGRGERERVVKKYMDEMAEQWKGAGIGLDFVMGLSESPDPKDRDQADVELASWVWRNLYASRGLVAASSASSTAAMPGAVEDAEMLEQLEIIVRFVRREMKRLDDISDADVLNGNIGEFGRVSV